jgi:hypothetical protein
MLTRSGLCLSALTGIKTEDRAAARLPETMGNPVFKCPRTGMNVQHRRRTIRTAAIKP